ncbi:MAG: methyltransferase domain-containing protein [Alphaproteobacteria bacterium]|nr:methyltransferase domain-containing protein [Alphaproteobacteria bacterium]
MHADVLEMYDQHPINETQVLAALTRAGKDLEQLRPEDLYDFDQDHYGGLQAVDRLIAAVGIGAGSLVLDVCCGLGGPARYVAAKTGARVVGIDLNAGRSLGARRLSERVGLSRQVGFVRGNAMQLPFADRRFDAIYAQEAFLHIPDKEELFAECRRVLTAGGKLGFTDWIGFPGLSAAARARLAEGLVAKRISSFADYRALLQGAGFTRIDTEDRSTEWREILRQRLELFRSMREDTVRQFGEERHRKYVSIYEFFVARISAGDLGGGCLIAS